MRSGISAIAAADRRWLPVVAVALSAIAAAIGWLAGTSANEQAVLVARYTARVSLGLFLIVYAWPAAGRDPHWLIAFVTAHLIHFATMVRLIAAFPLAPRPHELALGVLGYVLPLATVALPGDPQARWRRWSMHYVWLSFAVTYYHRLFEFPERHAAGVFAFALLMIALALRVVAAVRGR